LDPCVCVCVCACARVSPSGGVEGKSQRSEIVHVCLCVCVCLRVRVPRGGLEVTKRRRGQQFPQTGNLLLLTQTHTHQPPASEVTQTDRQTQTWGVWGGDAEGTKGGYE
jgi:hypothetical protein